MAPGNPFLYRDEHDDDDFMPITTSDQDMSQNIGNDDETKQTLVVSLTVNCISVKNLMQSLKVRLVWFCTPAVSMRALCIPVTNLNTRQHIRAILKTHLQSKQCEYQAATQTSLKTHQKFKHEGAGYSWDQCEYHATTQNSLKIHQQSKHEGVIYSCNECEYQATRQGTLRRHQQSKHEGVIYSCNHCEYQATQQGNLKTHQQSINKGVKYFCRQCGKGFWTSNLQSPNC